METTINDETWTEEEFLKEIGEMSKDELKNAIYRYV
jgi:hypothetical protein